MVAVEEVEGGAGRTRGERRPGYCHGQTMDGNKIHDCSLSIRAVIMAMHAWAKLGQMNGLSKS